METSAHVWNISETNAPTNFTQKQNLFVAVSQTGICPEQTGRAGLSHVILVRLFTFSICSQSVSISYCSALCCTILSVERCSLGNTSLHRDNMTPPLQEYSSALYYTILYYIKCFAQSQQYQAR